MKPVYLIRHKPTGYYMPEPTGHRGRGSSFWEPTTEADYPRVFKHPRSAKAALTQWLRGKHMPVREAEYDEFSGRYMEYVAGADVVHQPHRKLEDMEIVSACLTPVQEKA